MYTCDHCLLEFPENTAVFDETDGKEKVFCCHGCMGIYRFIHNEGLDDFYKKRDPSWVPGPSDDQSIELAAFAGNIKTSGHHMETDIILDGIRCASCIWLLEKVLLKTDGVTFANVNYATHRAKIKWTASRTNIETILKRIRTIGYRPKPFKAGSFEKHLTSQKQDLLIRFGTAAFFTMQLMLFSVALYAGYFQGIGDETKGAFQVISMFLTVPVVFYSGWPFIKGGLKGFRTGSFNMDVLIATGALSAFFYSIYQITAGGEVYFDTAAMIVTFILLGRYLETGAKGRASQVITSLLSLTPHEAILVTTDGAGVKSFNKVDITSVKSGDSVQVLPGETVPFDGRVIEGSTEVDESMLTGESIPVSKKMGVEIFCGTRNLYGSIIFRVTKTGQETVLSHIIKTVEDAQARQAPVQKTADRITGIFVPAVLAVSMFTGLGWALYGSSIANAVMHSVAVLVIACPCALGLATPLAILVGTTRAASQGILIKGGDIIERAKKLDTVIFDKTGTITEGKPRLESYKGIGITDDEALKIAASIEQMSEHSLAKAITGGHGRERYEVSGFTAIPGMGVRGMIKGKNTVLGNESFAWTLNNGSTFSVDTGLSGDKSATVVYLSFDQKPAGIFYISDKIRPEAAEAVSKLKSNGIGTFMISGDHEITAHSVASAIGIGIDKVMSRVSPVEKADIISQLQTEKKHVMMVGDGINDAPALVQADVGVAMGRATDIALESADMVLMRSNLMMVPEAISISRKIYRIIQQNLFWAFSYNIIALPLAIAGVLHPIFAALAMTLSSLSVVGNSMRLRKT